jgi:hypothetical protein
MIDLTIRSGVSLFFLKAKRVGEPIQSGGNILI